jgi:L-fuconolactonase
VIDAHHHFWDPSRRDYPWMGDDAAPIRRRFGPEDLAPLLRANGVQHTVLVQTVSSLEETREFLATAGSTDFVAGVVGWVDLTNPDVASVIAGLRAGPGGGKLAGIRHQVHDEPDASWLLRPDVQQGLKAVGEAGLVYDLSVRPRELPAALETVERHPAVRFVIDHMAKPRIAAGRVDPDWEAGMAPLARHPNVFCKLSGLVTEADWKRWAPEDLAPYVDKALSWFGTGRCMFGSDWPVCLLAAGYERVAETMRSLLSALKASELDEVFGGTAARVYRLPTPRRR